MKDNKHIDRVFQEKLKDLEVTPKQAVWHSIEASLNKKDKDRKVVPIWWKLGGVAAGLLLLLFASNFIFNNTINSSTKPTVVDSKQEHSKTIKNQSKKDSQNTSISNSNIKTKTLVKSKQESLSVSNLNVDENSNDFDNSEGVAQSNLKSKNSTKQKQRINDEQIALIKNNQDNTNHVDYNNTHDNQMIENKALVNATYDDEYPSSINYKDNTFDKDQEEVVVEQTEKEKIPLTEAIVNNENIIDEKEKEAINRWQISPNLAPVYFNTLGKGSSLDDRLVNNNKNGEVNVSYGISISYALNTKLTVKSGVNKVNLSYGTNDVFVYNHTEMSILTASSNTDFYKNIKLKGAGTNYSIINGNSYLLRQSPNIENESMTLLSQDMSFYEIPLELQYAITNKKIGFSLIGGFSTLFLSDNKISYESNGQNIVLGEATNINNTSFSANFGLGLDYGLSKKINLNLNPMFKYQLNTFNDTSGDFKPYFIGVYSGVSIKF